MELHYNFTGHKKIFFGISIVLILIGMIALFTKGLNADIEFKGGAVMDIKIGQKFNSTDIEKIVKDVTGVKPQIQVAGKNSDEVIAKIAKEIKPADTAKTKEKIRKQIQEKYNIKKVSMSLDNSSPTIGSEARKSAVISIVVACILMLIYITFRFEFKTGTAAVIALIHDVLIMVGVYAIFNIPVNGAFVAAILTIVGYSINDTIIVFDRIRENIHKSPREDLEKLTNRSINETLVRSVNTVVTVLITLTILFFMGVQSLKEFTFPLIIGITSGCYSSMFIASPLWLIWRQSEDKQAVIK